MKIISGAYGFMARKRNESEFLINFKKKKLFLFDLDGVLYKGKEKPTKIGGDKVLRRLREQGKKIFVLSNDSTDTREKISRNLLKLGICIKNNEIITSAMMTATYVRNRFGEGSSYFLIGERGLQRELSNEGLRRTDSIRAKVVVVGLDRHLTYAKLNKAVHAVLNGAVIVATHTARLYAFKGGPAVATGSIVASLEYATSRKAISIGKPAKPMFELALRMAGNLRRNDVVMVGDQLDTDIAGANAAGIDSILVRTGLNLRGTREIKPTAIVKNVDEIARFL